MIVKIGRSIKGDVLLDCAEAKWMSSIGVWEHVADCLVLFITSVSWRLYWKWYTFYLNDTNGPQLCLPFWCASAQFNPVSNCSLTFAIRVIYSDTASHLSWSKYCSKIFIATCRSGKDFISVNFCDKQWNKTSKWYPKYAPENVNHIVYLFILIFILT